MRLLMASLALALLAQAAQSESLQGCSTVNARPIDLHGTGWVLMRDDGRVLTNTTYCDADDYKDGLIRFDLCGGKGSTYLTPDGKQALTIAASAAGSFSEGFAAFQNSKDQLWGYMNKQGQTVIAPAFEAAEEFSEGIAAVLNRSEWRYIDATGKTVLTLRFSENEVFAAGKFKNGGALVVLHSPKTGKYLKGIVDRTGSWLVKPTERLTGGLENGLAPLWSESGERVGFVDALGRWAIRPRFTDVASLPFMEGLAAVYVGEKGRARAGFIDEKGRWVIEPKYNGAGHFCEGLAPVKMENSWGFVDRAGKIVIQPTFEAANSFDGGIAEVYERRGTAIHQVLINRKGKVLFRSASGVKMLAPE